MEVAYSLILFWEEWVVFEGDVEETSESGIEETSDSGLGEISQSGSDIDDPEEEATPSQDDSPIPFLGRPVSARTVQSWREVYQEGQYLDLGLTVGVYDAPPEIPGKPSLPGDKVPVGGRTPSWVYLCYSALAKVPGGKMALEALVETCLEWCPARVNPEVQEPRETAKRSASRSLSTNDQFFFSENKECWRLRDLGEEVTKFSGPAKRSLAETGHTPMIERGESSRQAQRLFADRPSSASLSGTSTSTSMLELTPATSRWTSVNSFDGSTYNDNSMSNGSGHNVVFQTGGRRRGSTSLETAFRPANGRRRLPDRPPVTSNSTVSGEAMPDSKNSGRPPPKKRKTSPST